MAEIVRIGALTGHSPLRGCAYRFIVNLFLGIRLFDHVHLLTIDCSSRVRPRQYFHDTTIFLDQTFIEVVRIAVWNKNKVAVAAATILWITNAAFFIQCKSLICSPVGHRKLIYASMAFITVIARVNIQFHVFRAFPYPIPSFTSGFKRHLRVYWSALLLTSRAQNST